MSRHVIASKQPGLTVAAGWDNPLQTFFAQVMRDDPCPVPGEDEEDEADPVVLWIGGAPRECLVPESLIKPLRPYADLTGSLLAQLRADRLAAGPASGLQRQMRRLADST